jgi:hypothetical protein
MEHSLVAWPAIHVIRARLDALTRSSLRVSRYLRGWAGLNRADARPVRVASHLDPRPRGIDACTPQPLDSFPVLGALVGSDPWFADPRVRVQRVWERAGWAGQRCGFFIARKGELAAGLLVRGLELAYCRLYPGYTLAAIDALFWSREVEAPADPSSRPWRGADEEGRPWMIRVLKRPRRWELHIAHGGVIPHVCEFSSREEALGYAEIFMRSPRTTRT